MTAPQTDLAQQLAQLAVVQGVDQSKRHAGKASLLYTFQEAADIDVETIYRVGLEGLDELCVLDGRFQPYRRTLFGQASRSLDRDASTADVNAKLDTAIAGFCTLLSSYFLLAPAFKALEFLVRKYKVHERNVEELMQAALPYHETEQFVRLVQILRLEPRSRWAFLEPMQKSGAAAPREVLVLRCVTDRSLLRFVCDMAQRQADPKVAGRTALPFYAVLVCEYLAKVKAVDEQLLTMLLPYLLAGLNGAVAPDYRAATYMIIGQLASRATFSADLVAALVTETCRTASTAQLNSVVMLLAHLANTQEHLIEMPERAFKHLAKVAGLVDQLAGLSEKGCRIQRLLTLLVRAAMAQLPARPQFGQLLEAMLTRVQMGDAARVLADAVLKQAGTAAEDDPQREVLQRLLRSLDLRCPEALDAAVNAALPQGASSSAGSGKKGKAKAQSQAGEQQRQQCVLALLNTAFQGTARCPLLEAGTTVLLAAEAPAVALRQMAVQRLSAVVASVPGSEAAAAAGAALLRRLLDDSPAVVQSVLSSASLMQLPHAALMDGLAACFERALQQAGNRAGSKVQRAEARGVARKALKLLTGPVLEGSPQLVPHVVPLLLAALLVTQACGRKVAATALKAARGMEEYSPLLAALQEVPLPQEAGGQEDEEQAGKGGKKAVKAEVAAAESSRDAADVAYNARVVAALAAKAASDPAAAAQLSQLLREGSSGGAGTSSDAAAVHAEPLLLMVAHAAVYSGGEGAAVVAGGLLRRLQAPGFQHAEALPKECFDDSGVPTAVLLERSMAGKLSMPSMQSTALLAALHGAPWEALAPHGTKGALALLRTVCTLRWQPALPALFARMAEQQVDCLQLLSELFAAPPGVEEAQVQLAAVQNATTLLVAHGAAGKKQSAGAAVGVALLGRVLCTLCHPNRDVRKAGVKCAHACANLVQAGELSDRARELLAAALTEQASLLVADAEALQRLLEAMLGADDEPPPALAGYVLDAEDAAGLGSALLAAAEEEAAAAAAAGRNAAAAAAAAHTARVLLELTAEWAPVPQLLGSCQRLLASAARMRAPLASSMEGQQKEQLLAAAAGCFTARRMEAVLQQPAGSQAAAGPVLDAWCSLLDPAGPMAVAAAARLAALQQVQACFFVLLPAEAQIRSLKALLRASSADVDENCRAAARAALAAMPLHADTLLPLLSLEGAAMAAGAVAGEAGAAGADEDMAETGGGDEDEDEELQRLQAVAAAAATAAARLGTPLAKQRRGKPSKEAAAAEEAARAAAAAVEQRQVRRQGRRGARGRQAGGQGSSAVRLTAAGESCVAVLELLQWKENVQERLALVPAVQAVLGQLLAVLASSADGAEAEEAAAQAEPAAASGAAALAGLPAAEVVYIVQLCLFALASMARTLRQTATAGSMAAKSPAGKATGKGRKAAAAQLAQQPPPEGIEAFDVALAVRAAQDAPDGAVRNSALQLVAELAQGMPQAALGHVLEVVAVVGTSAALQEDEHSEQIASQALRAILPAWIASGSSMEEMSAAVVAVLPRVSTHRRLALLSALVSALPQVEGLCSVLALLLEQGVQQQSQAPVADAAMAEADPLLAAGAEVEPTWAVDLAGDLMDQAPVLLQASTGAALLAHSLAASKQQPWRTLPLLCVAFVTQQLEQRQRAASAAGAEELAAAYQELMQECLLHLQYLGERQAAQARPKDQRGPPAPAAMLRTGIASCYRLLQALRERMAPAAFLSALVALVGDSPADRVRRKALHLLAAAVRDFAADTLLQQGQPAGARAAVAEAALSVCKPAMELVAAPAGKAPAAGGEPVAPLTKQTALAAVGAVAGAYGAQHPQQLLAALPAVLAAVGTNDQAAVRGSALATTAALAAALGPRLVPLLPKTVAAVISAVQSAAAAVTRAGGKKKLVAAAAAGSGSDGGSSSSSSSQSDSEGSSSGSGSEPDGENGAARQQRRRPAPPSGPTEAAALELAAALAAVAALVEHLGGFLAPHLPLLLAVLLHPAVLQCSTARCADVAAAIRRQLAQAVPTRLLLPPLLAHLEAATEAGADAVCGLVRMLQSAVDAMDTSALASHHEAVFGALLRALDLRRRRPAALLASSGALDRVEAVAVACFVALTLRLTEQCFKPIFFRLLEWAHAVPAGDSELPIGTGQLLRSVALFSVVNALADKLRSVFVPYFGLLLDACVAHLTDGSVTAAPKKSKKKKRKAEEAGEDEQDVAAPTDPLYVEHDWRLRLKVLRALHRCFLFDTGAGGAPRFLDEARFQRLLPPLVAHLGLQPPPSVAAALEADGDLDGAAELEASLQLGASGTDGQSSDGGPDTAALLDPFGRAVVAGLAQMGVTAGSDAQWKPLNHQVLMMTRSLDPRTRLLALETAAQLAGRLSEEYLALLPETLPFLSELLEDAELAVEARAQRLVRQLEAVSGESLAQYLS